MRLFILLIQNFLSLIILAQSTATFEDIDLGNDNFLNGGNGVTSFTSGNVSLTTNYNATYDSWTGWAISSVRDTLTPGLAGQYASRSGGGVDGSDQYAVSFVFGSSVLRLTGGAGGGAVEGLYLNNNSYAYYSMLNGDNFAKRFGGETGNDPDFLLLTIKGFRGGELTSDSVDFYLADYRFEDNAQDYIVQDWQFVDLTELGALDSLQFALSGSDNNDFGLKTPAYFCLDNVITSDATVNIYDREALIPVELFPNPVIDRLSVRMPEGVAARSYTIYSRLGARITSGVFQAMIDVSALPEGVYFIAVDTGSGSVVKRFVK